MVRREGAPENMGPQTQLLYVQWDWVDDFSLRTRIIGYTIYPFESMIYGLGEMPIDSTSKGPFY